MTTHGSAAKSARLQKEKHPELGGSGQFSRRMPLDLTSPCWPWAPRTVGASGYGEITIDKLATTPHRVSYQLHVGPIPKGWHVDHACHSAAVERGECNGGNCAHRSCWNPAHLETTTPRINWLRGAHANAAVYLTGACNRGHDLSDPAVGMIDKDGNRRCMVCVKTSRKESQDKKRSAGVCPRCPAPVAPGLSKCQKHHDDAFMRREIRRKELSPHLFCPNAKCLWRTGGGRCPKHPASIAVELAEIEARDPRLRELGERIESFGRAIAAKQEDEQAAVDELSQPFCACGRVVSRCDGSRTGCKVIR